MFGYFTDWNIDMQTVDRALWLAVGAVLRECSAVEMRHESLMTVWRLVEVLGGRLGLVDFARWAQSALRQSVEPSFPRHKVGPEWLCVELGRLVYDIGDPGLVGVLVAWLGLVEARGGKALSAAAARARAGFDAHCVLEPLDCERYEAIVRGAYAANVCNEVEALLVAGHVNAYRVQLLVSARSIVGWAAHIDNAEDVYMYMRGRQRDVQRAVLEQRLAADSDTVREHARAVLNERNWLHRFLYAFRLAYAEVAGEGAVAEQLLAAEARTRAAMRRCGLPVPAGVPECVRWCRRYDNALYLEPRYVSQSK